MCGLIAWAKVGQCADVIVCVKVGVCGCDCVGEEESVWVGWPLLYVGVG